MTIGICNCGSVSFEIKSDVKDVYMCHCSICRRWTGANGVAVVIVPAEDFSWLNGEDRIAKWNKPDADWVSCFCSKCGSSLPVPNDEHNYAVPAGLIDTFNDLQLAAHIWVGSKASWEEIVDSCPQYKTSFKA